MFKNIKLKKAIQQFNKHKPFNYTLIGLFLVFVSLQVQDHISQLSLIPQRTNLVSNIQEESLAIPSNIEEYPIDKQVTILEEILKAHKDRTTLQELILKDYRAEQEIKRRKQAEIQRKIDAEKRAKEELEADLNRIQNLNIEPKYKDMLNQAGVAQNQQPFAYYIILRESAWGHLNGSINGAYGLCQAYPGTKMITAGDDWETNPITQIKWCTSYAEGRYGSWKDAYIFWRQGMHF